MPSHCGAPEPTAHADVIVSGTSQDDIAQVTCDEEYVASPKDVPVEMRCMVTSRWTPFVGSCMRYVFKSEGISFQEATLPWQLAEHSQLCMKGVFGSTGQLFVSLMPDNTGQHVDAQICFRYEYRRTTEVVFNTKENDEWNAQTKIGSMPLVPGDSFNLTLHVQSDRLQYTLNEAHVYDIPLDSVQSTVVRIGGDTNINVTYINLISDCD
ncbi:uncharacterized protein [Littorina saxatilis]|uniref:uncharacterized protein n=1 Tax=Littorina saxatilis TaxID=31220 RepID=UPI0038B62B06